ncbi:Myb-like DNA-binding domain protein [Aspergillus saccharolyticus JOP 1030-1]|uniref:Myb-like DNA-binding domain protein n=1 Tax=Aspergillus saccharolyticus JOP 1030-1 TaxID=1450539 RepID=A0A318ZLR0_9EURO|nr:hypothetical protein BP01DRAFT_182142 [Aspergillus saccharolyticus JOP 1030-1]PYH41188.1 hypothetical protein BP01DRAFT_182142 [Aspergillus saccharolyticus JOP 1030-1]
MERPTKRARFALPVEPDEDGGDDIDIHEARAQNDQRLKSIFEGIFEKYGKDFTDVGDEIDLQTGKIIVNNGHIQELEEEGEEDPEAATTSGWRQFERERSIASDGKVDQHSSTALSIEETSSDLAGAAGMDGNRNSDSRTHSPALSIPEPQSGPAFLHHHHQTAWEEEASDAPNEVDDDEASVDSLLDNTLRIESILPEQRAGAETDTTTGRLGMGKAKPAAEAPAQSHGQRRSQVAEELWRVPEIDASFSTPTWNRSRPTPAASTVNRVRSQSPPGAGSLWSVPATSRRGPRRDHHARITKSRPQQRTTQSSPVVCDWSFAETPDGDESDDPLQENYEPSPTPKRSIHVRRQTAVEAQSSHPLNYQCADCKQVFVRGGYITHLKAIASRPFDGQHDRSEVARRLEDLTNEPASKSPAKTTASATSSILIGSVKRTAQSRANDLRDNDATPTKKRARNVIQPDEARLIITMRQVQGKKWSEILDCLPHTKLTSLIQWNCKHWSDRRANPPLLSKPWSKAERAILSKFVEQEGLSWTTIREKLPGRPHAGIEFELLQLWAGKDAL